MVQLALALVAGLLFLLTAGIWYFYQELVVIWFVFLLNFVKGITFKTLLTWLVFMLRRWFLIEVPKLLIRIMAYLMMPWRWRAWVRAFAFRLRQHMEVVRALVEQRFGWLFGRHVAILLAALASVSIFVVGVAYFGVYVVYFFGGQHLFAPIIAYCVRFIQHYAFKLFMFFQLDRATRFLMQYLPKGWLSALKSAWYRFKRFVVKRRKALTRRIEAAIFGEKPQVKDTD